MQSNILVIVFYIGYFIVLKFNSNVENHSLYHILKGAIVMAIFLTFIVYIISLQPLGFLMDVKIPSSNVFKISNILVHFITPIMVFLDYIIFDKKGYFKKSYTFIWIVFPAIYPLYVYTYSSLGGEFFGIGGSKKYAYFFLDLEKLGIRGVLSYILLFAIFYIFICILFIKLDRFLGKRKKNNKKSINRNLKGSYICCLFFL